MQSPSLRASSDVILGSRQDGIPFSGSRNIYYKPAVHRVKHNPDKIGSRSSYQVIITNLVLTTVQCTYLYIQGMHLMKISSITAIFHDAISRIFSPVLSSFVSRAQMPHILNSVNLVWLRKINL